MNRNHRNILAENLRHYLSGTITNFEFMDRIEPIYPTDDKGVKAVENSFWYCYDDLRKHQKPDPTPPKSNLATRRKNRTKWNGMKL